MLGFIVKLEILSLIPIGRYVDFFAIVLARIINTQTAPTMHPIYTIIIISVRVSKSTCTTK